MKNSTAAVITISADLDELTKLKDHVLMHFSSRVKVPGFREGKVPANVLEKHVDPAALQNEFLEEAVERMYMTAIAQENLRPVQRPQISVKKFVPYTTLEFEAEVAVIGEIKLPDYKKVKKGLEKVEVTAKDVQEVLDSLALRMAQKNSVERAAKAGDEAWIDFAGVDEKKQPVNGADGKDYPLILGSNTFIPGFEDNVTGMKPGEEKTFTLTFPKDYGVKALANRKVTFTVTLTKLEELIKPKLDDEFAKKAGPFASLKDLKDDIKKQIGIERQQQAQANYEAEIVREIASKSKVDIPEQLIDEQTEAYLRDYKQNLAYRGLTWEEFMQREDTTEEAFIAKEIRPKAIERLTASLVLSAISEQEGLDVTPEELEVRIKSLKEQYKDAAMQAELDKPENRRDIASRVLTEKTIARLVSYAS